MLIGSGLLARAFSAHYSGRNEVCIYAAGVSNSSCTDTAEFHRERTRLGEALRQTKLADAFVYFGTCSVSDPEAEGTPYVQHKLAMERLVSEHPRFIILRLPQVAGRTPNPHTLLNFLYARISRSESFQLWSRARRNIIDVADVAAISTYLIDDQRLRNTTVSVANPASYPMPKIVEAMERAVGKSAIYDLVERGSSYPIDVQAILPYLGPAGVRFGNDYLEQVTEKYYGKSND
jgi:nucleoside-diphosphate-sugar epimerase